MAINKPIVDAGPTVQRRHILDQPVNVVTSFDPSGSSPDYEGQLVVGTFDIFDSGISPANNLTLAEMYVGVDISGTLTWIKASFSEYIDGYSGESFDPMHAGQGTLGG